MKQAHVRFDATKATIVPQHVARAALIRGSVKPQTNRQYDSRLRVLSKFLAFTRGGEDPDVVGCTEDEFVMFLFNWMSQGGGNAEGFRSALLARHRQELVGASFLMKAEIKKMVKGAGSRGEKRQKGVVSEDQGEDLKALIRSDWGKITLACNTCNAALPWDYVGESTCYALDFMVVAPVRPGNLKDFRVEHLRRYGEIWQLWVEHLKTAGVAEVGGWIEIELAAALVFQAAAEDAVRGFLFPRCVAKHLDEALRRAQEVYGWAPQLVYSPHCLRHTMMMTKKVKVVEAVTAIMTGVSKRTLGIYTAARDVGPKR